MAAAAASHDAPPPLTTAVAASELEPVENHSIARVPQHVTFPVRFAPAGGFQPTHKLDLDTRSRPLLASNLSASSSTSSTSTTSSLRQRAAVASLVLDAKPEATPEAVEIVEGDGRIGMHIREDFPKRPSPFSNVAGERDTSRRRSFFASRDEWTQYDFGKVATVDVLAAGGVGIGTFAKGRDNIDIGVTPSGENIAGGRRRKGEGVGRAESVVIDGGVNAGGGVHKDIAASGRALYERATRMGGVARPKISPMLPNRRYSCSSRGVWLQ